MMILKYTKPKTVRSTGTTYAYYNGLMSVNISKPRTTNGWVHKVATWEHAMVESLSHAFAEPDDSGSWVYTHSGEVFGMLKSGDRGKGTINDIFNDIKNLTDAAEVRIILVLQ